MYFILPSNKATRSFPNTEPPSIPIQDGTFKKESGLWFLRDGDKGPRRKPASWTLGTADWQPATTSDKPHSRLCHRTPTGKRTGYSIKYDWRAGGADDPPAF